MSGLVDGLVNIMLFQISILVEREYGIKVRKKTVRPYQGACLRNFHMGRTKADRHCLKHVQQHRIKPLKILRGRSIGSVARGGVQILKGSLEIAVVLPKTVSYA